MNTIILDKYGPQTDIIAKKSASSVLKYSNCSNNSSVIVKKVQISHITSFIREIITLGLFRDLSDNLTEETSKKSLGEHVYIIHMKEAYLDIKTCYIIEEYIGSENRNVLTDYLSDFHHHKYQPQLLKQIFYDIGCGLALLRNYNILYRDCKPDNIIIYKSNNILRAKLIDFGLSRKISNSKKAFSTDVYTHHFHAPELLIEDEKAYYGYPAEIWSLSITIVYSIKSKYLFEGEYEQQILESIIEHLGNQQWEQYLGTGWLLFEGNSTLLSLLKSMLIYNPHQRLDIFQYLNSSFFEEIEYKELLKPLNEIEQLQLLDCYPSIYPFRKNRSQELSNLVDKARLFRSSNYNLLFFIYDSYFSSFFRKDPSVYIQYNQNNEKLNHYFEMAIIFLADRISSSGIYHQEGIIPYLNDLLRMIDYKVHVSLMTNYYQVYGEKYNSEIRSHFFSHYQKFYHQELVFSYSAQELTLILIERLCYLSSQHYLDAQNLNILFKDSQRLDNLRSQVNQIVKSL